MHDTGDVVADQRYSSGTILDYVNEAQREINNLNWLSEKTTEYILSPRTTYYSLPSDLLNIQEIRFGRGVYQIQLEETSRTKLKELYPNWESVAGSPIQYLITQTSQSVTTSSSALLISYIQIPTNVSTGAVKIVYWSQVDDLVNDTDVPFNAKKHLYPYHMSIVYHATMRLKAIDGRIDEAAFYEKMYANSLAIMQKRLGTYGNYKPGFSGGK